MAGGKFSSSHLGVVGACCPRVWTTRLNGPGKGHVTLGVCVWLPTMSCTNAFSLTPGFPGAIFSSWPLANIMHCFPISSPHFFSPQFFLMFSKCFFTSVKLSCLHIYFDLWKCLSTVCIYHKHCFFQTTPDPKGKPKRMWWIEMEVKGVEDFPKNHSHSQFHINAIYLLSFAVVPFLTYRFSDASF